MKKNESSVECRTINFSTPFATPCVKQHELHMLNHIACVVLKQHYFSICCRGAASTAFRCVGLKKPRRAKSGELCYHSTWLINLMCSFIILHVIQHLIKKQRDMPFCRMFCKVFVPGPAPSSNSSWFRVTKKFQFLLDSASFSEKVKVLFFFKRQKFGFFVTNAHNMRVEHSSN